MAITAERLMVEVEAETSGATRSLDKFSRDSAARAQKANSGYATSADKAAGAGRRLGDSVDGAGRKATTMGNRFSAAKGLVTAAVGSMVVGLGVKAVNAAKNFDLTMRQVGVQTGETGEGLKSLSDLAIQTGKDTMFSAQDASNAMLELAKGGLTSAEIKAGALQTTMTLAAAGTLEMGSAAEYVTQAMNTFDIAAGKADQVAVALAGGANASTASVESLGMALSQVGPGATNAGMSLQETVAALAAFDNAGIKGSDAGTSLKTMLANLVPTTEGAATAMKEYGLEFVNANGEFKSMTQIAGELQRGLGGLSEAERVAAMRTIFGSDATRAATVLMKEGASGVRDYIKATKDQSVVQDMANTAMGGASGAWEEFTGSLETLAIQVGTALIPAFISAAQAGAGFVDWLSGLGGEVKSVYQFGKEFLDGFLAPFAPILEPLGDLFSKAGDGASIFKEAMSGVGQFLGDNARTLGKIAGVISMLFIPALVQAGVAYTVLKVKAVASMVATAAASVKSALMVGVAWAKNVVVFAQVAAAAVAAALRMAASAAMGAARVVASWVMMGAAAVAQGARMAAAAAASAARTVAAWVLMGAQSMIQAARMAAAWVIAMGPVGWAIAAAVAVAVAVIANWDRIVAFTKSAWGKVKGALSAAWDGIKAGASAAMNFLKNLFLNFTGPGLLIKHWDKIKSATRAAFNTVKNWVSSAMGAVRDRVADAANGARSAMTRAWDAIVNAVRTAVGKVVSWVQGIKGKVLGALSGAAGWLTSAGSQIIDGLWNGLKSKWESVKSWFGSITSQIPDLKGPAKRDRKLLVKNGREIMKGLQDGLTGEWGEVRKYLRGVTKWIAKNFHGEQEKALTKAVNRVHNRMKAAIKRSKELARQHEAALAHRDDLRQQKADFRGSVFSGITAQANVLNAGNNASTIRESLQAQLAKVKEFAANLTRLRKMGYSKAVIMQVASAGIEQGAEVAKALAAANVLDMKGINEAFAGITELAGRIADDNAGAFFNAGISAAEAVVNGLEDKMDAVAKVAAKMAAILREAIADALNIPVPGKKNGNAKKKGKNNKGAVFTPSPKALSGSTFDYRPPTPPPPSVMASGGGSTINFSFTTVNPIAEPESQTVNKSLERVSALGLVGG